MHESAHLLSTEFCWRKSTTACTWMLLFFDYDHGHVSLRVVALHMYSVGIWGRWGLSEDQVALASDGDPRHRSCARFFKYWWFNKNRKQPSKICQHVNMCTLGFTVQITPHTHTGFPLAACASAIAAIGSSGLCRGGFLRTSWGRTYWGAAAQTDGLLRLCYEKARLWGLGWPLHLLNGKGAPNLSCTNRICLLLLLLLLRLLLQLLLLVVMLLLRQPNSPAQSVYTVTRCCKVHVTRA